MSNYRKGFHWSDVAILVVLASIFFFAFSQIETPIDKPENYCVINAPIKIAGGAVKCKVVKDKLYIVYCGTFSETGEACEVGRFVTVEEYYELEDGDWR